MRFRHSGNGVTPAMYAFTKSLRKAQHVRRYSIQTTSNGWEVKQEQDSEVLRQSCYQDWHRVERARRAFVIEMITLREEGWQDV